MNTHNHTDLLDQYFYSILIVEEDQDDQMFFKLAFERLTENLSPYFLSTEKEALDYLQQTPDHSLPDVIVLNYNLHGTNDIKLQQQLNSIERYKGIEKAILCNFNYFAISKNKIFRPKKYFIKPDSFVGYMQLTEQLIQMCYERV